MERTFLSIGLRGLPKRLGGVYVSVGVVNPASGLGGRVEVGRTEILLPDSCDADFSLRVELPVAVLEELGDRKQIHAFFEAFSVGSVSVPNNPSDIMRVAASNAADVSLGRWSCPLNNGAIGLIDTVDTFLGCFEPVFARMRVSAARKIQEQEAVFGALSPSSRRGPIGPPRVTSLYPLPTIIVTAVKASEATINLGLLRLEISFADIPRRQRASAGEGERDELRNPFILIERRDRIVESGRLAPPEVHGPAIVSLPVRGGGQVGGNTGKDGNDLSNEVIVMEMPLASLLRIGSCRGQGFNISGGNGLLQTLASEQQVARFSVYDWIDAGPGEPTFDGPLGFVDVALDELLNPATIALASQNCITTPLQSSTNGHNAGGGAIVFRYISHGPWILPPLLPPHSAASAGMLLNTPPPLPTHRSTANLSDVVQHQQSRSSTPPGRPPHGASFLGGTTGKVEAGAGEAGTPPPRDPPLLLEAPAHPFLRGEPLPKRTDAPPGPPPPSAYGLPNIGGPLWELHGAMLPTPLFPVPRRASPPSFTPASEMYIARPETVSEARASRPGTVSEARASRLGVGFFGPDNALAAPLSIEAVNTAVYTTPAARIKYMSSLAAASSSSASSGREAHAPTAVRTVGDARSKLLLSPTIHSALGLRPGATGLLLPFVPPYSNSAEAFITGRAVTSSSLGLGVQRDMEVVFERPNLSLSAATSSALDLFGPQNPNPPWTWSSSSSSLPLPPSSSLSTAESFLQGGERGSGKPVTVARARGVVSAAAARRALANPKYTLSEFSSLLSESRAAGARADFLMPILKTLEHTPRGPRARVTCASSEDIWRAVEAITTAMSSNMRADLVLLQRGISDAREEDEASARTANERAAAQSPDWNNRIPQQSSDWNKRIPQPSSTMPQVDALPVEVYLGLEQAATNSRLSLTRGLAALEAVAAPAAVSEVLAAGLSAAHWLCKPASPIGGNNFVADIADYDTVHDEAMRLAVRNDVTVGNLTFVKVELRQVIQTVAAERLSLETSRDSLGEALGTVATDVGRFEGLSWAEQNSTFASRHKRSSSSSSHLESATADQLVQLGNDPLDATLGCARRHAAALARAQHDALELVSMQYAPLLSALREKALLSLADVRREGEERMRGELGSSDGVFHAGLRDAARARESQAEEIAKLLGVSRLSTTTSLPSSIALTYERYIRPLSSSLVSRLDVADEETRIGELSRVAAVELRRLRLRIAEVDADLVRVGACDADKNKLTAMRRHIRTLPVWYHLPIIERRIFLAKALMLAPYTSGLSAFLRSEVYPHSASLAKQIARSPPIPGSGWMAALGGEARN